MVTAFPVSELDDFKMKSSNQKKPKGVRQSIKNSQSARRTNNCSNLGNDKSRNKGGLK
jgi:hypothetical protein